MKERKQDIEWISGYSFGKNATMFKYQQVI